MKYSEECTKVERAFAHNLAAIMERRQVDAKTLAEKIGATETSVKNWLSGKPPRFGAIEPIRRALNVAHHQLFREPGQ